MAACWQGYSLHPASDARASRVTSGSVGRNVEVNDDEAGTLASGELNPSRARILLKLALLKTSDAEIIQQYFYEY